MSFCVSTEKYETKKQDEKQKEDENDGSVDQKILHTDLNERK